ncbi:hypothetical protein [Pseudohaliea rubra]|uniref:Uncharacterized protein n=1 Tax=Pseudohaliea rubra DSM 19751 TaxID=1265313 RepID=A0A095WWH3_9GAMM|nr:hypothetical protein [Pseudohaliea rubra]KGE02994.1 hypothetical protein HRUBRA_02432 [Pseudohaliea rubra DSM 19751]
MLSRTAVITLSLLGLLLLNVWLARLPWASLSAVYQENGLLEHGQLALAVLAALLAAGRAVRSESDFGRRLFAALALAFLAIVYREADFRACIAPGSLMHQLSYLLKYAIFPACYGYLLFLLLHCLRADPPRLLRFLFADIGVLLPLATALVLCAAALDKSLLDVPGPGRLVEEVLELNAYALLLLLVALGERRPTVTAAGPGVAGSARFPGPP